MSNIIEELLNAYYRREMSKHIPPVKGSLLKRALRLTALDLTLYTPMTDEVFGCIDEAMDVIERRAA